MKLPELLVPGGTYEKMEYAFAYGADAVYAGVPKFSLRARENDFTLEKLRKAVNYSRDSGRKFYLTMNIFPHNRKVGSFLEMLDHAASLKPDALIMADPGMIAETRELHPEIDIHLSTQANTINWQSVKFWKNIGLKRIILSRELSIDEIKEIKDHVPDIELETFIHGAICVAYSGRCLLSNYFTHRDANQGTCTNACRWQYSAFKEGSPENSSNDSYSRPEGNYFIEETERPGEFMPIDEDEHGTYIMNAKDLSTISILKEMADAGIDSFKVEGRTKSVYYLSIITRAYRWALDSIGKGIPVSREVADEVYAVANRGYITGFLERHPQQNGQNYAESHSANQTRLFAGLAAGWDDEKHLAKIKVRNRFKINDKLELVSPAQTVSFTVKKMFDEDGKSLKEAHGGGKDILLALPEKPEAYSILRKVKI